MAHSSYPHQQKIPQPTIETVTSPHALTLHAPYTPFRNPVLGYLARLNTADSQQSMRDRLRLVAKLLTTDKDPDPLHLRWEHLTYGHLMALRAAMLRSSAPASVNLTLAAVRGVLKECWRMRLMTHEDMARAGDIPAVRGEPFLRGRALTTAEFQRLFDSCATDPRRPLAIRDTAILAVMYQTGARAAEVLSLDVSDYDLDAVALLIRRGKGGNARRVFLTPEGAEALQAWLRVRGDAPGPLFPRIYQHDTPTLTRLGRRGLLDILHSRATVAGVPRFGCHDLRRSMVTGLLTAGVDLHLVSQIAGHASMETTKRYDKRPETAQREAIQALKLPPASGRKGPDEHA